jgi:ATP-dependent DNA helicase RecG
MTLNPLSPLPIGIGELLSNAVEGTRLELKATWEDAITAPQVIKVLCAFANDLQNQNGGYVIIGVGEVNGAARRPVDGLAVEQIDRVQKTIRGECNRIEPVYMPVMHVENIDGKQLLVLWAPASDARPHQAPDEKKGERAYWVRVGSETVAAKGELRNELLRQTARIPFDDRRSFEATNADIHVSLAHEFLRNVGSELANEPDSDRLYAQWQITARQNGHTVPKNIALLFFTPDPTRWFRCARIELAEFGEGGDTLAEHVFRGPLHHQIQQCITWLESATTRYLEKRGNTPESRGWVSFPLPALRETLVNAVYHRSYESDTPDPIKVHLYWDRIEIVSYPGPAQGIQLEHLCGGKPVPPVPARNRRIGEFLKELRLAEARGTGVPKIRKSMLDNGSPVPTFDFDEPRSYFRVVLPAHPEYVALNVLRAYVYKNATGDTRGAQSVLEEGWRHQNLKSPAIAVELARTFIARGELERAREFIDELPDLSLYARVITTVAEALIEAKDESRAKTLLDKLPSLLAGQDAADAAIAERRLGRDKQAHALFARAGDFVLRDTRSLHEFAQTKMALTAGIKHSSRPAEKELRQRLLSEAAEYLERVLQMDAPAARHAWASFDQAKVLQWLRRPKDGVDAAIAKARALAPKDEGLQKAIGRFESRGARLGRRT